MPSQFPALRLTLARQMEGYKDRMARQIGAEMRKRGENDLDLAQAVGTHTSTVERWRRAERMPQRRHRKELAEHWGLPLDAFEFDIETEEKEVRDQLDRIETKLDRLLIHAGLPTGPGAGEDELGLSAADDLGPLPDDGEDEAGPGEGKAAGS